MKNGPSSENCKKLFFLGVTHPGYGGVPLNECGLGYRRRWGAKEEVGCKGGGGVQECDQGPHFEKKQTCR